MISISFNKKTIKAQSCTITVPYNIVGAWISVSTNYIIVLMDPNANLSAVRFNNLIAYNLVNPADISWQAELPTSSGPDCFTEVDVTDNMISAFSFSCFRCEIDICSGKIITKSFTK